MVNLIFTWPTSLTGLYVQCNQSTVFLRRIRNVYVIFFFSFLDKKAKYIKHKQKSSKHPPYIIFLFTSVLETIHKSSGKSRGKIMFYLFKINPLVSCAIYTHTDRSIKKVKTFSLLLGTHTLISLQEDLNIIQTFIQMGF